MRKLGLWGKWLWYAWYWQNKANKKKKPQFARGYGMVYPWKEIV
jgi:hypothetical protein